MLTQRQFSVMHQHFSISSKEEKERANSSIRANHGHEKPIPQLYALSPSLVIFNRFRSSMCFYITFIEPKSDHLIEKNVNQGKFDKNFNSRKWFPSSHAQIGESNEQQRFPQYIQCEIKVETLIIHC